MKKSKLICGVILSLFFFQMVGEWHRINANLSDMRMAIIGVGNNIIAQDEEKKYIHISIDDSIGVFKDIVEKKYVSIFENKELSMFKEMHEEYGLVVSLYFFYEKDGFNLTQMSNQYIDEFQQNAEWLRFGFHSFNSDSDYSDPNMADTMLDDYEKVLNELIRITGGKRCIDHIPRIHLFAGSLSGISNIQGLEEKVIGLLSADDDRNTYMYNADQSKYLASQDYYYDIWRDLYIVPTDIRLEFVDDVTLALTKKIDDNVLIIFTHEWKLDTNMYSKIEECCALARKRNYTFTFMEDRLIE